MEREVELAIVGLVESVRARDRALRGFDDELHVRTRPRIGVGQSVHAAADRLGIALVRIAARGPNCEDGLMSGPLMPKLAQVVARLGSEPLARVDCRIADEQGGFAGG